MRDPLSLWAQEGVMGPELCDSVTRKAGSDPMTKLNTYTKGNRIEKLCRSLFEEQGWLTWKPSRAKFNSNDAFGLFDCIMVRGGKVIFMQVKSTPSHFYSARKEIAAWIDANHLMITAIVSLYEGNNLWRLEWYDTLENEWCKYHLTSDTA